MRQGAHRHSTAVQRKATGRTERRTLAGHVLYEWPPVWLSSCRDSSQTTWHCRGTLGFNKPMHRRSQKKKQRARKRKKCMGARRQFKLGLVNYYFFVIFVENL